MREENRSQSTLVARRQFFEQGIEPSSLIAATILRSWQRCAQFGLVSHDLPRIEPITGAELRDQHDRNALLRQICRPELEALFRDAQSTDSIVILTDPSGLVLDTLGDMNFATRASRVALRPGVTWSERITGTNAIGTAIVERRPVQVNGSEHYFEPHRILSCTAAPILGPKGEIIGVLDLSGPASMPQLHATGLVRLAIDQIEHRFFERSYRHCDLLRFHRDKSHLGTPREGILALEGDRLIAANRYGLELLRLGWDALGKERLEHLFARQSAERESELRLCTKDGVQLFGSLDRLSRGTSCGTAARRSAVRPARSRQRPAMILDEIAGKELQKGLKLIEAEVPLLLQGETGTGKEVFARELHALSSRADKPFVAINCGALPETLIESELFGYEEGAFTGARRKGSPGLLREAEGGVLLLDEIGDMPLSLQPRLLRVLQEREVKPLGGGEATQLDFALICATHRNLAALVEAGKFRADLYFRIAQYGINLQPLRAAADRRPIVRQIWSNLQGGRAETDLAPETERILAGYSWPGNFRQLTGVLKALLAIAEPGCSIGADLLPSEIRERATMAEYRTPGSPSAPSRNDRHLSDLTRDAMRDALEGAGGNVSLAARKLGVHRSTLYRRLFGGAGGQSALAH